MVKNSLCLFCGEKETDISPYENTVFNNKNFEYLKCRNCELVYVAPLPNFNDFEAMYPTSYQGELFKSANGAYNWLFKEIEELGEFNKVLDYGCGRGNFIVECLDKGLDVTGIEFNPELVANLKAAFSNSVFYTIEEFNKNKEQYDIIFLGNVLEHLTNPLEILILLRAHLSKNGLLILEGPIENNFTLAGGFRKWFFYKRKKKGITVSHPPRHIFYSNYKNQIAVLEKSGFKTIKYKVWEQSWPFPQKITSINSIKDFIFFIVAKTSKVIDKLIPKSGNVFFYIGTR